MQNYLIGLDAGVSQITLLPSKDFIKIQTTVQIAQQLFNTQYDIFEHVTGRRFTKAVLLSIYFITNSKRSLFITLLNTLLPRLISFQALDFQMLKLLVNTRNQDKLIPLLPSTNMVHILSIKKNFNFEFRNYHSIWFR